MVTLLQLWLPILLSAVAVFAISSVVHMLLQFHQSDYRPIPGESRILAALREEGLKPGGYVFPHCQDMKEMGSPETIARFDQGPVGFMTVLPNGPMPMGKSLLAWFLYSILIGVFCGYVGSFSLAQGAGFGEVFRVVGTVGVLGYAVNCLVDSIWRGVSWGSTLKFVGDGLAYGLATGAIFGWLWPGV